MGLNAFEADLSEQERARREELAQEQKTPAK